VSIISWFFSLILEIPSCNKVIQSHDEVVVIFTLELFSIMRSHSAGIQRRGAGFVFDLACTEAFYRLDDAQLPHKAFASNSAIRK
jgi:hypothetical protein